MKAMGIDTGSANLGVVVLDGEEIVGKGTFHCRGCNVPQIVTMVRNVVYTIAQHHKPDYAAIEDVFLRTNPSSFKKLTVALTSAYIGAVDAGVPNVQIVHQCPGRVLGNRYGKFGLTEHEASAIGLAFGLHEDGEVSFLLSSGALRVSPSVVRWAWAPSSGHTLRG